jgi:hypothetical protein
VQADSGRQADGFRKPRFGVAQVTAFPRFAFDLNHERIAQLDGRVSL